VLLASLGQKVLDFTKSVLIPITDNKQSRDQSNPSLKYTTITAFDDDRAPIGVTDYRSDINEDTEGWMFRESTGQLDLSLDYYQGIFAKNIGGKVGFPWGKNYRGGGSECIEKLLGL
jgi:hypothetical protein